VLVNLLKLLVDKNRTAALEQILDYFDLLTDEDQGVEEVTLVSAVPLSDEQREQIVGELKRFSAYGSLRVETAVDPALIGGVLVRLGRNQVIDGTVASRFDALRSRVDRRR
jgi:F-type H+-transporting ATPase subunit delta